TDSEETSALEAKLGTALKAGRRLLVFDCSAAGQLTSSALRVLLLTSRKLDRTEGRLVLCGMNARLTKAFSISGFDKDVTVVATREGGLLRVREPVVPRAPRQPRKEAARKDVRKDAGADAERKEATPAPPVASEPVVPVASLDPPPAVADAPVASVRDAI